MKTRIVHLSSLHPALDVRIFHKECRSLARAGFDVHLVVHDPPAAVLDGVTLHAIPPAAGSKWTRAASRLARTYRAARALEAPVYHFHDPELIPVGAALKARGATVVYDVHEDAPREALTQLRARPLDARILSATWRAYEALARRTLDGFVCATDDIASHFPAERRVVVANYPMRGEFEGVAHPAAPEPVARFLYVGGLSKVRGVVEMLDAVAMLPPGEPAVLELMGRAFPAGLVDELARHPGWGRVDYRGWQEREAMVARFAGARAGLVVLQPAPEYVVSLPIKLFEYMAAGLPVVASDFPLWREIVEDAGCGLLVDPTDPAAIAGAMTWILRNPAEARAMGERGRRRAQERYSWDAEARRLTAFYEALGVRPEATAA